MPILQTIVLAVVQGLTEFLPVSSTAHLYLTSWLLGWHTEALQFDIMLHIGTLLAVLIYFFRDWVQIIGQGFGIRVGSNQELKHNHMLLWLMAIGTVPVAVAGALFQKQADTTWRNPLVMGVMLVAIGALMWYADNVSPKQRDLATVNLQDSLAIGAAQALAVVPAIGGAAALTLWHMHKEHLLHGLLTAQFVVGVGVSAVTGCAVIAWFLHYLGRYGLRPFAYYRIIFGIIVIALAFIRPPA